MLVELGLVEQRYKAMLEVLDGAVSVTTVARRYGVGRRRQLDHAVAVLQKLQDDANTSAERKSLDDLQRSAFAASVR